MAKPAHRTPKPAVHAHLPVNQPTVKREGPAAGSGVQSSLNNPFGARIPVPGTTNNAPGQPPIPPASAVQLQGAPAPAKPRSQGKFSKAPTGRRPRTGDEA
jgi:hypothetical protein